MAKVTKYGYQIKTQNEYFQEQVDLYQGIDAEWELDPSTPDGLKIAKDSEIFGNLDECLQDAYNSKDPAKATGIELDIICALTGTTRAQGTSSVVAVKFTGVNGTVIPLGTLIDSGNNTTQWTTNGAYTIGVDGTVTGYATCSVVGAITADVGSINRIPNPIAGLQGVTNIAVPILGTNRQTDAELRISRALAVGRTSSNQVDSILSRLFEVTGVTRAKIVYNDTGTTNQLGIPPRSMGVIVYGGADYDIAKAIFQRKAVGSSLVVVADPVQVDNVYDLYVDNAATILFNRPILIPQVVSITLVDDGTLPANVEDQIRQSIIDYVNGSNIPEGIGFNLLGYNIGQPVPINRLYTPINRVLGAYGYAQVTSLTVNGLATGNSPIEFNEFALFTPENISVVVE